MVVTDKTPITASGISDLLLVKVAREIAIDHFSLETILEHNQITPETWDKIKSMPRFQQLLVAEISAWQSAINTTERAKLKAAALIEEWLPEAATRLFDQREPLNHKTELGKLVARIAGIGVGPMGVEGGAGEKFSITINLGADQKLKVEKQLPPKVIDAEVVDG